MKTLTELSDDLIASKKEFIKGITQIIKEGSIDIIGGTYDIELYNGNYEASMHIWVGNGNEALKFRTLGKVFSIQGFIDCEKEVKEMFLALPGKCRKYERYNKFVK